MGTFLSNCSFFLKGLVECTLTSVMGGEERTTVHFFFFFFKDFAFFFDKDCLFCACFSLRAVCGAPYHKSREIAHALCAKRLEDLLLERI